MRNIANPLKIGRRSKVKQASASKPNLVAILRDLSCHLKIKLCCMHAISEITAFQSSNINNILIKEHLHVQFQ